MQQQATQQKQPLMFNGLNMDILQETVGAVAHDPELGKCKFRASNYWNGGSQNTTRIAGFYGAREEHVHKDEFVLHADEPTILAGHDEAANPVEYVLHALAACVTTTMVAHGAVRGIEITSISCDLEGDIDINGFLGLKPEIPKGYTDIRMHFTIKADINNTNKLLELVEYSPVYNMVSQGVNVDVQIDLI